MKKCEKNRLEFENVYISQASSAAGKLESQGPYGGLYDVISTDNLFGQSTWEKAETAMQKTAFDNLLGKCGLDFEQIDLVFAGDLLNQSIGSTFAFRNTGIPFLGIYGACSTFAQGILMGAMAVEGGFAKNVVTATSSHFCSAERQFRTPLEYGGQRAPTSQWTVTGSGACLVTSRPSALKVTGGCIGSIIDMGVDDVNNMGAAMAVAAFDTIKNQLEETNTRPSDYDLIATGDLGSIGRDIVLDMAAAEGIDLRGVYTDCGVLVYDPENKQVCAGGSGCGCSAIVSAGYIFGQMRKGKIKRALIVGTGALMSPTSALQKESIPGIAHAVEIVAQEF